MSDSAETTNNGAPSIQKSASTSQILQESLVDVITALTGGTIQTSEQLSVVNTTLLASGGYNYVWLVKVKAPGHDGEGKRIHQFVYRIPKADALLPDQLENEVAWLTYVSQHTSIPVPKVYAYSSKQPHSFVALEYIDGQPLGSAYKDCTADQQETLCTEIANIIVQMAELRFDKIGGLLPSHELGPTVEGVKLFKGRDKFHSHAHYNIGPYSTTKDYILAYYDKEICYYSHASNDDIDWSLFYPADVETVSRDLEDAGDERQALFERKEAFVEELNREREKVAQDEEGFGKEMPFVLCHGDFEGRNVLVREGRVVAVIDWEFAGSFPLCEMLAGKPLTIVEYTDRCEEDEEAEKDAEWCNKIIDKVEEFAIEREWSTENIDLLLGQGNEILDRAREEMFPTI
ncbi:uncharacterized protein KY384_005223 [Bacidia gigantensis]|uniref:uncharacterized protein n=1 Tax=Bacidia gigantensis TaxID=2732470 RepID=UPI001D043BCA|nr:uncharacterized protein KY384_005223 [Bacidia gigantensis]KAG8529742.1 hypothetical protein KY384_005223 [Bacidia gigantensis]